MWEPADFFKLITPSDWKNELADISNWSFERVPKRHSSPTCVFTILIKCRLSGFERIQGELNVDEKDLAQTPFRNASDPISAYVNYARTQFKTNQLDFAARAMASYRAKVTDSLRAALSPYQKQMNRIDSIQDPGMKAAAINIANMKWDMKKKGIIGKNAPYAHVDYRKIL